jgi:hypothetical protein
LPLLVSLGRGEPERGANVFSRYPTQRDLLRMFVRVKEGYAKLSLKKWSPIAARNDDLKVFNGRR